MAAHFIRRVVMSDHLATATALATTVLIACKDVCRRTSLSRASLYRLMAEGSFPKPVPLHGVRKAWIETEVDAWIASRIAARNAEAA
jgi:prophage regulatory protein